MLSLPKKMDDVVANNWGWVPRPVKSLGTCTVCLSEAFISSRDFSGPTPGLNGKRGSLSAGSMSLALARGTGRP